jgi:hypothetical protein
MHTHPSPAWNGISRNNSNAGGRKHFWKSIACINLFSFLAQISSWGTCSSAASLQIALQIYLRAHIDDYEW